MKIISISEFNNYAVKELSRGKVESHCVSILRALMENLVVGESVEVLKEEWTNKSEPRIPLKNGKKFTTHTLANNSGWLVKRIV
jgi:hypothetical protein